MPAYKSSISRFDAAGSAGTRGSYGGYCQCSQNFGRQYIHTAIIAVLAVQNTLDAPSMSLLLSELKIETACMYSYSCLVRIYEECLKNVEIQ